jgi:predicted AAA+ superfamily ATPase
VHIGWPFKLTPFQRKEARERHERGETYVDIAGPVRAWAALRPSSVESRHGAGLTELVGRDEEIELLLRRWAKAKAGDGQVVLLSGEAGIGKSRLTAALLENLAGEAHTRLRYFCSPRTPTAPYTPSSAKWSGLPG